MKLVQFRTPESAVQIGKMEKDIVVDITNERAGLTSVLDALRQAEARGTQLEEVVRENAVRGASYKLSELDVVPQPGKPHLLAPIFSPEVWGCGVTYKRSADAREDDAEGQGGFYDHAYSAQRPEVFFKTTTARCRGPNNYMGMRGDSSYTAPEPELALILDSSGNVHGFTCANDVSAWDIEQENPLYLPQSKTFDGCCCLGPCIATREEITDPKSLQVACTIIRDGTTLFSGETNTSQMKRDVPEMIEYLTKSNPIPCGTVLMTGTGIIIPDTVTLKPGDIVEITIEHIGTLRNYAKQV